MDRDRKSELNSSFSDFTESTEPLKYINLKFALKRLGLSDFCGKKFFSSKAREVYVLTSI